MALSESFLKEDEIIEFKNEAFELLSDAESRFLALETGASFTEAYGAIFRAFHSLKGAAGMLGLEALKNHMHQLESHFHEYESSQTLTKDVISHFLAGIDQSRNLLIGKASVAQAALPEPSSVVSAQAQNFPLAGAPNHPNVSIKPETGAESMKNLEKDEVLEVFCEVIDFIYSHLSELNDCYLSQGRPNLALEMNVKFKSIIARYLQLQSRIESSQLGGGSPAQSPK